MTGMGFDFSLGTRVPELAQPGGEGQPHPDEGGLQGQRADKDVLPWPRVTAPQELTAAGPGFRSRSWASYLVLVDS